MPKKRTWTIKQLKIAVENSTSYRQTLIKLHLQPTGGNYDQLKKYIRENALSISHFTGKGWSKGKTGLHRSKIPLSEILVRNSSYQSYKLKNRLYAAGLKKPQCEICSWAQYSTDGRLPLELDHINGDRHDNRLSNLRILCPNCHSLQPTHRGKNRKQ